LDTRDYLKRNLKYNREGERILYIIDVVTFEVIDFIDVRDKFGGINIYQGREDCE